MFIRVVSHTLIHTIMTSSYHFSFPAQIYGLTCVTVKGYYKTHPPLLHDSVNCHAWATTSK